MRIVGFRKFRRELSYKIHLTRSIEFGLITRHLRLHPARRVCDIGACDGYWTRKLAQDRRHVFGIDIDTESLARAHRYYGHDATFVLASAEYLPFADCSIDGVVCMSSMQHFDDDHQALNEIRRILRPRGRLCMTLDSLSHRSISPSFKSLHAERFGVRRLYTHVSISALLDRSGFCLLKYMYLGRSKLSSWLMQYQVSRGWNVNYLAPITIPLFKMAEGFTTECEAGYTLFVVAEKGDETRD